MPAISLLPIDDAMTRALELGPDEVQRRFGVSLGQYSEVAREVAQQTMALVRAVPRSAPWGGYLAVDDATQVVIGTCGYKYGPTPGRTVELAYFTFPAFERQGYATLMATRLVALAAGSPQVDVVVAHTLPERNPSTRVLEKVGMRWVGDVVDPEDGPVWRWELKARRH